MEQWWIYPGGALKVILKEAYFKFAFKRNYAGQFIE
jgi:hypothetical protein